MMENVQTQAERRVIVVGGGLAGMACAVGLAEAGIHVTLVESRFALGGRAGSFEDPETGELLDNCQHVLLGCCTNLLDLYRRMGVDKKVAYHGSVHFLDKRGRRFSLWGMKGLPAPLHLGWSLLRFEALTLAERRSVMKAMRAMLKMGKKGREEVEGISFGEWMKGVGVLEGVITKFFDPVVISALNEETRKGSAKYAIQVFQDAMMANRRGYLIGLPEVALGELYQSVPGVDVKLNTRVEEIVFDGGRAVGVKLRGGEEMRGDAIVLATNHHAVQRWIPAELAGRDARFGGLDKIESVPILGVHLWFDRPVMTGDMYATALIEGPLQWLFRKDREGRAMHGVISAAREWASVPKEEALQKFERQVRGLFAAAREAKLLRGVIVIEKRATFSPLPGTDALRPEQGPPNGGIENLFLAGDYTKSGWPATMEGAVRSGYLAAEGVLKQFGVRKKLLVDDLPVEWAARLAGMNK